MTDVPSTDWAELRRLAEAAIAKRKPRDPGVVVFLGVEKTYAEATQPEHILALLDRAEKAEAEAARLREALRPFAAIADEYDNREDGNLDVMVDFAEHFGKLRLSAFRRARALTGGDHG